MSVPLSDSFDRSFDVVPFPSTSEMSSPPRAIDARIGAAPQVLKDATSSVNTEKGGVLLILNRSHPGAYKNQLKEMSRGKDQYVEQKTMAKLKEAMGEIDAKLQLAPNDKNLQKAKAKLQGLLTTLQNAKESAGDSVDIKGWSKEVGKALNEMATAQLTTRAKIGALVKGAIFGLGALLLLAAGASNPVGWVLLGIGAVLCLHQLYKANKEGVAGKTLAYMLTGVVGGLLGGAALGMSALAAGVTAGIGGTVYFIYARKSQDDTSMTHGKGKDVSAQGLNPAAQRAVDQQMVTEALIRLRELAPDSAEDLYNTWQEVEKTDPKFAREIMEEFSHEGGTLKAAARLQLYIEYAKANPGDGVEMRKAYRHLEGLDPQAALGGISLVSADANNINAIKDWMIERARQIREGEVEVGAPVTPLEEAPPVAIAVPIGEPVTEPVAAYTAVESVWEYPESYLNFLDANPGLGDELYGLYSKLRKQNLELADTSYRALLANPTGAGVYAFKQVIKDNLTAT